MDVGVKYLISAVYYSALSVVSDREFNTFAKSLAKHVQLLYFSIIIML